MPRFVVSVESTSDFDEVLSNIKKVSTDIVVLRSSPNKTSKRTSGLATVECSDELAERVRALQGIRHFEPEIIHRII